jgi:guanylate kinase
MGSNALLMVSGPSGIGKTSLVSGLIAQWPSLYVRPISYTSRPKRSGEDDSEYRFVSKEWILEEFQHGNLANLDNVYGNLYAIAKSSIDAALERGLYPIKEIHPRNHGKIRRLYQDCAAILVLPDAGEKIISSPGKDSRLAQDAEFYSLIEINDFEVIARSSKTAGLNVLLEDTYIAIQSYLTGRNRFPNPGQIDILNASGYRKVAGHFTTQERPTTANFHDLSKSFFKKVIDTIPQGVSCLEIGPGQGWLRKNFHWPQMRYFAVDIASSMIATLDF